LQNLEPLLNDHRRPDLKKVDVEDSDLAVLTQPMVKEMDKLPQPLWKPYKEWLVVMLAHFNAVETLIDYVTGPFLWQVHLHQDSGLSGGTTYYISVGDPAFQPRAVPCAGSGL